MNNLSVESFFDTATSTLTYVVWDPKTHDALVIDPVLDFDPTNQIISRESLKKVSHFLRSKDLRLQWVLETHAHADHLSAARELKAEFGAQLGMGRRMNEVFETFKKVFAWPASTALDALGVDRWFKDGEEFSAGSFSVQAIETPGHTPACVTYRIGEWLFTGDAIMMPDAGVGRCDFPGGSAKALYDSIWRKLYSLPEHYQIFVGHDYQPGGRPLKFRTTVGEQKNSNLHLKASTTEEDFVKFREGRDKTLSAPRLLDPSLDWNLGAHQLVPQI